MAKRLAGRFGYPKNNPFAMTLYGDKIDDPLKWRKPQRVFVCSMGDLFHEDVPEWALDSVMDRVCYDGISHHTFILLTKCPERMKQYFVDDLLWRPPPNVWLMVTAENQRRADERIPILLDTPAAVRGVSLEPLLGPVNLNLCHHCQAEPDKCREHNKLNWIVLGAETGPGARPMNIDWARSVRDQCIEAGILFWFKVDSQGNHELDGQVWEQFPEEKQ